MDVTNAEQSSSTLSKDKPTVDSTGKLQIMNNRLTLLEINTERDIIETINSYRTSIIGIPPVMVELEINSSYGVYKGGEEERIENASVIEFKWPL